MYTVIRYHADGHAMPVEPLASAHSLNDARAIVFAELASGAPLTDAERATLLDDMRWSGAEDDIEAYHGSFDEGCGGYAIRVDA